MRRNKRDFLKARPSTFKERVKLIKKIGLEYGRKKGASELAKECGLSKQRISQIVCQLRKRGIKIPLLKPNYGKAIDVATEELKKLKRRK